MVLQRIKGSDPNAQSLVVKALEQDGAVVIQKVVDRSFLQFLKARMDRDTKRLLAFCEDMGGNPRVAGQLQQGPPTHPPYLHTDMIANPLIWGIAWQILGLKAELMFYSGNTNCPGSKAQAVHIDRPYAYVSGQPPSALNISIPVQDTMPENGAIELWLGTHHLSTEPRVSMEDLRKRRAIVPPIQPSVRAGDVLLRNPCTWHRAMTNPSQDYRHMVAVVIHRQPKGPVDFDSSARDFIEKTGFPLNPHFCDYRQEYLFGPTRWLLEAKQAKVTETKKGEVARPLVDI